MIADPPDVADEGDCLEKYTVRSIEVLKFLRARTVNGHSVQLSQIPKRFPQSCRFLGCCIIREQKDIQVDLLQSSS